jgi:transcriptional regulatory protein LevR
VVKDLISGDGLKLELKTTQELLEETNKKLETQTMLVGNLQTQVNNFVTIIDQKDKQIDTSSELSNALEKQLKRESRTKKLYQITSAVGAGAVLLLLIQK